MFLISNLFGEYDSTTPAGRGANAASNLVKYFIEARKIAEENTKKLLKGEISINEACKNSIIEKFSQTYITYAEVNEETGVINMEYAMAFVSVYINGLDTEKDGFLKTSELGTVGQIIDMIDPNGKITKGKLLAWLIFQDCVGIYNGVISPQEAAKALIMASSDPLFVVNKLKEIYNKLDLKEKENMFIEPQPVKN